MIHFFFLPKETRVSTPDLKCTVSRFVLSDFVQKSAEQKDCHHASESLARIASMHCMNQQNDDRRYGSRQAVILPFFFLLLSSTRESKYRLRLVEAWCNLV
jgi:hypothetical protein